MPVARVQKSLEQPDKSLNLIDRQHGDDVDDLRSAYLGWRPPASKRGNKTLAKSNHFKLGNLLSAGDDEWMQAHQNLRRPHPAMPHSGSPLVTCTGFVLFLSAKLFFSSFIPKVCCCQKMGREKKGRKKMRNK
ncbi:hypothetical protein MAPG_11111 [Magnaporthiopsis poae ATCC 64411]|uniref:Uncharacterized protein n=1 Tax=Magnaporthiopsis poae (strain ATCC 64411 / 73-15) TaxID=644358 RepID=A0A0C4EED9_MAGP6|nr:hypothetical protein MAPG_11111 [Magnaporthiopsis poae ATCC 64411]